MTARSRTRKSTTTPTRVKDQTVSEPTTDLTPTPSTDAPKKCANHPDRDAVLTTNFPWASEQSLCTQCIPPQYRHLL